MIVVWLALLLLSGCCGVPTVAAVRKAWLEVKLPPDARATALLNEMTLSEKVDMVHGHPSGPGLAQNCSWGSVNTTRTCVRTLCFSPPPLPPSPPCRRQGLSVLYCSCCDMPCDSHYPVSAGTHSTSVSFQQIRDSAYLLCGWRMGPVVLLTTLPK